MLNKTASLDDAIATLRDGMRIGIGGWATRRKPMALVRALARSSIKDLTVHAYGGPDIGILAACGKIKKLVFPFVSLDHYPLEPHFRAARQAGLNVLELDEGMFHWGLRAAAMQLPFLPTRVGIGTDIINQPELRMVKSPYDDGEDLVAMPALKLDAALLHCHRSDAAGNVLTLSPDPFFDELFARAADHVIISCEKLVPTAELNMRENARFNFVERSQINIVVEAPLGAHPTSANPDYQIDLGHLKNYVDSAASAEAWQAYRAAFIDIPHHDYTAAIGGREKIEAIPAVIY